MSRLLHLLDVRPDGPQVWIGPPSGPDGKRTYGGHLAGQALAAALRTVDAQMPPTAMHVQFLRAGAADAPIDYRVESVHDGRTTAARRVSAAQGERLLATATVSCAAALPGPEHGSADAPLPDPEDLPRTGPTAPAPSMPLEEIDIRIADTGAGEGFTRRFWWRATAPLPADAAVHACVAVYVTDVYMLDPALQVHGIALRDRTHRTSTTGTSVWFHRPVRADRWTLLESTSPAAARGRGVVIAGLLDSTGVRVATVVQEGLVTPREKPTTERT